MPSSPTTPPPPGQVTERQRWYVANTEPTDTDRTMEVGPTGMRILREAAAEERLANRFGDAAIAPIEARLRAESDRLRRLEHENHYVATRPPVYAPNPPRAGTVGTVAPQAHVGWGMRNDAYNFIAPSSGQVYVDRGPADPQPVVPSLEIAATIEEVTRKRTAAIEAFNAYQAAEERLRAIDPENGLVTWVLRLRWMPQHSRPLN